MGAPRTLRTGKHRRGRSLPPSAAPPALAPAPVAEPLASLPAPPAPPAPPSTPLALVDADPVESERLEAPERVERIPGLSVRRPPLGPVAMSLVVVAALFGSFAVARGLAAGDTRDAHPAAATAVSAAPLAAWPVASPVEKRASGPVRTNDGVVDDAPEPELDVVAASDERWEARAALEVHDLRRAIDVASRAVRHDPSQADGWLLLAAAYFDLHDRHRVKQALVACVKIATRGPRGECIALLATLRSDEP